MTGATEPSREPGLGRIEVFSDAVFAIAITLLALYLRPARAGSATELVRQLAGHWPEYVGFMVSFLVIGRIWINHRVLFSYLVRADHWLLWLNLLVLLGLVVLPFTTGLLGENVGSPGGTVAVLVYGGWLTVCALLFNGLWLYASAGRRLVHPAAPAEELRARTRRWLLALVTYPVATPLALIDARLPLAAFLLLGVLYALPIGPIGRASRTSARRQDGSSRRARAPAAHPGAEMAGATEPGREPGLRRIEVFSDAMFAIAITLLALGLRPARAGSAAELVRQLAGGWPAYVSIVVSFFVIGLIWINHRMLFSYLVRADHWLLWLNLLLLLYVVVLPFTTGLMGENVGSPGGAVAVLVYGGWVTVGSLFFIGLWLYASMGCRLVDPAAPAEELRALTRRWLRGPVTYPVATALALIDARLSLAAFALLGVLFTLPTGPVGRGGRTSAHQRAGSSRR